MENKLTDIQKNHLYEIEITGMTNEGNGVGRIGQYAVFVPDTAVGDRCVIRLVKKNKSFGYGKLESVCVPAETRVVPDCAQYKQCGGCAFRHISYEEECRVKEKVVADAFFRIGGILASVSPIIKSERVNRYRNKAQYPFGLSKEKKVQCGFYARRSHRIIDSSSCALHPPIFDEIRETVSRYVQLHNIPVYDEQTHGGLLRHLYLRIAEKTDQIMVCFVCVSPAVHLFSPLAQELMNRYPQVTSVVLNVNSEKTNVILGKECITIAGSDTIEDVLCGVRITLSPLSFYQVNRDQAEVLYQTALSCASLTKNDLLLDLYCGAGTIGLAAASQVKEVIGVEIVPEAIKNAKENAARNGISHASFYCADAKEAAKQFALSGIAPDVIVVDPPRKGLDGEVVDAIQTMAPKRLVMVSCNPSTAARDTRLLADAGYTVEEIIPVDMFPRTTHVETVVLLSKGEIDSKKIRVEFSLEDMDMSEFQDGATYTQIKDYVLEHTGLKVSSLYISQIKRKCGLEVGQNYNRSKSENPKVPKCPAEKEAAIMEALKYFGMTSL